MAHHDAVPHHAADHEYRDTPAGAGHEHTDANVGLIVKFAIWLVVAAVGAHVASKVMFDIFVEQRTARIEPEFPLAGTPSEVRLPAAPRLQRFPANEIYEFRLQEREVLEGYGWIDRNAGIVRIPIEEAMRLTVERGLPSRAAAPAQAEPSGTAPSPPVARETPGLMPTDSSAGRLMERRRQ